MRTQRDKILHNITCREVVEEVHVLRRNKKCFVIAADDTHELKKMAPLPLTLCLSGNKYYTWGWIKPYGYGVFSYTLRTTLGQEKQKSWNRKPFQNLKS